MQPYVHPPIPSQSDPRKRTNRSRALPIATTHRISAFRTARSDTGLRDRLRVPSSRRVTFLNRMNTAYAHVETTHHPHSTCSHARSATDLAEDGASADSGSRLFEISGMRSIRNRGRLER